MFHNTEIWCAVDVWGVLYNVALYISKQSKLDQTFSLSFPELKSLIIQEKKNQTEGLWLIISSFPANSLNAKPPFV